MRMINDENTLEDILGALNCAQAFPDLEDLGPIEDRLQHLVERIKANLAHNTKKKTRTEWFNRALEKIDAAKIEYQKGNIAGGADLLEEAERFLVDGNKAHLRKTRFVVDPSGNAQGL